MDFIAEKDEFIKYVSKRNEEVKNFIRDLDELLSKREEEKEYRNKIEELLKVRDTLIGEIGNLRTEKIKLDSAKEKEEREFELQKKFHQETIEEFLRKEIRLNTVIAELIEKRKGFYAEFVENQKVLSALKGEVESLINKSNAKRNKTKTK